MRVCGADGVKQVAGDDVRGGADAHLSGGRARCPSLRITTGRLRAFMGGGAPITQMDASWEILLTGEGG